MKTNDAYASTGGVVINSSPSQLAIELRLALGLMSGDELTVKPTLACAHYSHRFAYTLMHAI